MWPRSLAARTVGIGDVSLARSAVRGVTSAELRATLHAALEGGSIDVVEIAPDEHSERLVGDTIRELRLRDRTLAITRVPALGDRSKRPRDVLPERLPVRYVQDRVEASLRATRLEALPVVELELRAAWRASSAWPELVGTCARLVREGKVLQYAGYLDTIEDDSPALADEAWLVALSVPFSLCERAALPVLEAARRETLPAPVTPEAPATSSNDDLLAAAAAKDPHIAAALAASMSSTSLIVPASAPPTEPTRRTPQAVLARRPLAGGALAGTLAPGVKLRPDDDRHLDAAMLDRIAITVAKLSRFVKQPPPAARATDAAKAQLDGNPRLPEIHCTTLPELALRYVLDHQAIALPRLHHRDHMIDVLAATLAPPLPRDLVENLDI